MSKPEIGTNAEIARKIAATPQVVQSAVGSLATEWAARMAEEPNTRVQQATTASYYDQLVPEGATPAAILQGDYGEEAQLAFLSGALMAIDECMTAKLEETPHTK